MRAGAANALAMVGPRAKAAIPALLEVLGDEELEKVSDGMDPVVDALAAMGSASVMNLAEFFKDDGKKPLARWQAVKALSKLGRKAHSVLPILESGFKDGRIVIAMECANAYVRAGGDVAEAAAGAAQRPEG